MGYELFVTRKDDWFDEHGPEIEFEEWQELVAGDASLEIRGEVTAALEGGEQLVTTDPTITAWMNESKDVQMWFYMFEGNVIGKNPDPSSIAKMHEIAQKLDARLMGEEGEIYDAAGRASYPEFEAAKAKMAEAKPRPWWKFWSR